MASAKNYAGIFTTEKDNSNVVTPAGNSVLCTVIESRTGRSNMRYPVTRDKELVSTFGIPKPIADSQMVDYNFFGAMEFLAVSNNAYVVRATSGTEAYSNIFVSGAGNDTPHTAKTITEYSTTALLALSNYTDGNTLSDIAALENAAFPPNTNLMIASVAPGLDGNLIGVTVCTISGSTVPTMSGDYNWAGKYGSVDNSIVKISVFLKNSSTDTAFPTSEAEVFYGTMDYNQDPSRQQLYLPTLINGKSKYIYVRVNSTLLPGLIHSAGLPVALVNGADSNATCQVDAGNKRSAWTLFTDKEKSEVSLMMGAYKGSYGSNIYTVMETIAGTRMDCVSFVQVDAPTDKTVDMIKSANTSYASFTAYPSYVAKQWGYDQYYDVYNDRICYLPRTIAMVIACARTDAKANTWIAPAGKTRGGISYSKGANVVLNDTQCGILYDLNINYAKKFPEGFFIFGQKTAQTKKSALDRINVRRLLIYIEKSVTASLMDFLFEPNNTSTQQKIKSIVDGFMSGIGESGVTSYQTICDDTNNTSQVIDNNELILDLFLVPTKSTEVINFNVVINRTGVVVSVA